jgi:hypothetical protein
MEFLAALARVALHALPLYSFITSSRMLAEDHNEILNDIERAPENLKALLLDPTLAAGFLLCGTHVKDKELLVRFKDGRGDSCIARSTAEIASVLPILAQAGLDVSDIYKQAASHRKPVTFTQLL